MELLLWRQEPRRSTLGTRQFLLLAVTALLSIPARSEEPTRPLSVWGAVAIAVRNNPDLGQAAARVREATARLQEVRSAYYPTVSIDTGYLRSNAPSVVFGKTLDQRALDMPNANFNDPDTIDNFEAGGTLRYGLYDPGRKQRAGAASHALSAQASGREAVENGLVDAVVKAYYTALEAAEAIGTAEASVKTVESELKDTRTRFTGGAALETDVLSLEVRLATARENLIRAQNARRLAIAALANVMGLEADTDLQLSGEEWRPRALPDSYESGLRAALQLRPELKGLREQLQAARSSRVAAKRAYRPRVDAQARGYLNEDDLGYDTGDGNWLLGLTISLDLFDGHRRRAQVQQAQAALSRLTAAERKLVQGLQLEVKQAYIRLEEAGARGRVTSAAVTQAEKVLGLVKKQFQGGAATITRYLEAEQALTNARRLDLAARYDEKKSMAEVGRAVGYCVVCAREELSMKE